VCIAERIELVADVVPHCRELFVLLAQFAVAVVASGATRLCRHVLVLVDLGQRLLGLAVLKLEEPRREERLVLHRTLADDVVELAGQDAGLDAVLEPLDDLLGDDRDDLGHALELEVLLEQRVLRARARVRLAHERPVLLRDVLGLELLDLRTQLVLALLVRGEL
jgi:hypothetical protein